ncbi:MAG: dTMP kinase [Gammaproteobacteria bacterium]|nr:dTMP kinase [Gammaproteobacteria bacterium]
MKLAEMSERGKFITVEGMEGVGKTTNIGIIESFLEGAGIEFETTREPGANTVAESIRTLLVDHGDERIDAMTELLLVFAARAQHLAAFILPTLAAGTWVVCDRFTDSTYAYQGGGRGIAPAVIADLERITLDGVEPDLTFVLDLAPEEGLARAEARGARDRFESEGIDFFHRVRQTYLERARAHHRMKVIDASADIETVGRRISSILEEAMGA